MSRIEDVPSFGRRQLAVNGNLLFRTRTFREGVNVVGYFIEKRDLSL